MSDPSSATSTHRPGSNALQRGKACLRCRKRKMRCDGARPACQQCVRAKKGDCCEYDDGKGKTRTQLLREHISRLESRIRELEDPELGGPTVQLFDPHVQRRSYHSGSSSSSNASSPAGSTSFAATTPFSPFDRPTTPYTTGLGVLATSPSPSIPDVFGAPVDALAEPLPGSALAHMMLDIFLPHRHQLGLEIYADRLRDSLSLPAAQQPHPVLMNAIFLWSCFLSRPGPLSQHEPMYLSRALGELHNALAHPFHLLDALRGSCLLSQYFLCTGRIAEGSYHAGAAASLALRWDFHRAPRAMPSADWDPTGCFVPDVPMDTLDEGERIAAWWQVYNLDRCWSAALRRAPAIPADKTSALFVDVPWPQSMQEYQSAQVDDARPFDTVKTFLAGQAPPSAGGFSTAALRAKASALYAAAVQLAAAVDPKKHNLAGLSAADVPEFAALDATISRFLSTLLPVSQLDAALPEVKHALVAVHALAQAALIKVSEPFAESAVAHERCLRAAREMASIVKHLMEADYSFLDPILGACWMSAAEVLFRETTRVESSWPLQSSAEARGEIGLILYALTTLSNRFPIVVSYATQVQNTLAAI